MRRSLIGLSFLAAAAVGATFGWLVAEARLTLEAVDAAEARGPWAHP